MGYFFLGPHNTVLQVLVVLPVHDVPFPVYPGLHVQLKDPSVLLQKALESQLWTLVVHSLISERKVKTPYFQHNGVDE